MLYEIRDYKSAKVSLFTIWPNVSELSKFTLIQSEQNGHAVSATDILTFVLCWYPFRHLLQYTKCFIRQKRVGSLDDLKVCQSSVFLYYEPNQYTSFDAFLFGFLRIMHLTCNEHITFCHVTWIGRHDLYVIIYSGVLGDS